MQGTQVSTQTCTATRARTRKQARIRTYACAHTHICAQTHAHMRTHAYTRNARTRVRSAAHGNAGHNIRALLAQLSSIAHVCMCVSACTCVRTRARMQHNATQRNMTQRSPTQHRCTGASTPRHATLRRATLRHATPRHATPRKHQATPRKRPHMPARHTGIHEGKCSLEQPGEKAAGTANRIPLWRGVAWLGVAWSKGWCP